MTTTLGIHGEIGIPSELREVDHLDAGDRFEIERVLPGRYVLSRVAEAPGSFAVATGTDGLPVIRAQGGGGGAISAALVREIEGLVDGSLSGRSRMPASPHAGNLRRAAQPCIS